MIDTWLSAAEGDASGMWFGSVFADLLFPHLFVRGQYAAAGSADYQAARDYFARFGPATESNFAYAATSFGWGGGALVGAWPVAAEADTYDTVRRSQVETLLISGELDFATPPQTATDQLLPSLPNGRQVVLPEFGHVASFWTDQPEAGTKLITAFFDSGRVDDSLYRPQSVDFTPPTRHSTLAKIALGGMLAWAALTVLSLLGMGLRLRTRGRFGPVVSALLRAPYAAVLGVGGWCLGALVVLTTLPAVNLADDLLAVLAVGAPVATCVWLAWVHTDWPGGILGTGLTTVAGGSFLGAWLGFNATSGPLALVAAVVTSTAAANLALVAVDIARDLRSGRAQTLASGHDTAPARG